MSQEQLKVLEMVAAGKITPEDGERLLNALGSNAGKGRSGPGFDMPEIKIPKIDLGGLGEVMVDIKKTLRETARAAKHHIREGRVKEYVELKDFSGDVAAPAGLASVEAKIEVNAGQLKLKSGAPEGILASYRARRVKEGPQSTLTELDGKATLSFNHDLGSCILRLNDAFEYALKVDNAAADSRLDLTDLRVSSCRVTNNAGNLVVLLGGIVPNLKVDMTNNAGNIHLSLDDAYALRVAVSGTLSSSNLETAGLVLRDGWLYSPDWETNDRRIEILLAQNVANFSLRWREAKSKQVVVKICADDEESGCSQTRAAAASPVEAGDALIEEADRLAKEAEQALADVDLASTGMKLDQGKVDGSGDLPSGDL